MKGDDVGFLDLVESVVIGDEFAVVTGGLCMAPPN